VSTARRTFEPPLGATVSGFPPSDCSSTTFLGDGEAKHFYKRLGFRGFTDVMAINSVFCDSPDAIGNEKMIT
jgi:hypothetical protein